MGLPAGPKAPSFIQFIKWLRDPLGFLDRVYAQYGDVFTMRLIGMGPMVIVAEPDAIKQLFVAPEIEAPGDEELKILLGENSVLLLNGSAHKHRRRLLMPPFNGSRMTIWGNDILAMTDEKVRTLRPGDTINVRDVMQEITLNVMLQITFGTHAGARRQKLREDVGDRMLFASKMSAVLPLWLPFLRPVSKGWKQALAAEQACDEAFYAEIAECKARQDPEDPTVLAMLCQATEDTGELLEDVAIRDELMTLMVAGHENTAAALSWLVYWLADNPDMYARLMEEIEGAGPDADPMALAKLPYLDAICHETLRFYPPVMLTMRRVVRDPVELAGETLAPGTKVWGSIYLAHRREQTYENAYTFDPDRFLDKSRPSQNEFIPFGGGHRRCIGMAFAIYEMKLIIVAILRAFQFELLDNTPLLPKRRTGLLAPDTRFSIKLNSNDRHISPPEPLAAE